LATLKGQELTTTAKRRSADTSKLLHQLKGDLDWIVMKCLEKDRTRRYETANGLMADIQRHLKNEPVVARPPSNIYRFQKMVRRNKLAYAAGIVVVAALLVGTAVSVWQARVAIGALRETEKSRMAERKQRLAAQQQRDKATSAQAEAENQRSAAEAARRRAQAESYAADINLADEALKANNLGRARQLLGRHRPAPGQPDLRNWEWRYLWQECRGDALVKFQVQTNGFADVAVSYDGRWLATGGGLDATVSVFDIAALNAPRITARLPKSQREFSFGLACSPREPLLAYCDSDGFEKTNTHRIHLWNFQTQTEVLTLRLTNFCVSLAFSSDGQKLVTLGMESADYITGGDLTVWRCSDGAKLSSFPAFLSLGMIVVNVLALAPDFGVAAYCGSSNTLYVVDLARGTNRWTAKTSSKNSDFQTVAISPDGKLLVSAEGLGNTLMRFWDLATGEEIGAPIAAHEDWIGALRFLPDGRTLVSTGGDHTIRLWDVSDPRNVRAKGRPLLGQESGVNSVTGLPDGRSLISGANDGSVCVWDISGERRNDLQAILPGVRNWEVAPDGQSIFAIETNRVVQWHGASYEARTPLFDRPDGQSVFSTDGRLLITVSTNGVLQICDIQQRRLVRQFGNYPGKVLLYPGRKNLLVRVGNHFDDWDLDSFQMTRSWDVNDSEGDFQVSDNREWLFKWDYTGSLIRSSIGTDQSTNRQLDINQVISFVSSANGRRFAASSFMGYARVWETASFRSVATVGSRRLPMRVECFSPDGSRLLTMDLIKPTLRLWDIETARELIDFNSAGFARFSTDGNLLGWIESGSLHIYRAPTLAEIDAVEKADAAQTMLESQPAVAK
jgi:WD40 repeat protein